MKDMSNQEAVEMMRAASREIKDLRATIERLTPKADAYDKLSIVLELLPQKSRGYGEDLAYKLDRRIEELTATPKPEKNEAAE